MDAVIKWEYENRAKEIVEILNHHMFDAKYAESSEAAKQMVEEMIPEGAKIAVGGSVTLNETGILADVIRDPKYNFIDRYNAGSYERMLDLYREGFTSDVFVCSANAVTKEGQIVSIDCTGNRVASMIFGPKKVIVVVGVNKVVDTLEDGIKRCKKGCTAQRKTSASQGNSLFRGRHLPQRALPCKGQSLQQHRYC